MNIKHIGYKQPCKTDRRDCKLYSLIIFIIYITHCLSFKVYSVFIEARRGVKELREESKKVDRKISSNQMVKITWSSMHISKAKSGEWLEVRQMHNLAQNCRWIKRKDSKTRYIQNNHDGRQEQNQVLKGQVSNNQRAYKWKAV